MISKKDAVKIAMDYFKKTKRKTKFFGIVKVEEREDSYYIIGQFQGEKRRIIRKVTINKTNGKII